MRMVLEELGGSIMRIRANDCVGAHQIGYVLDAAFAHLLGLAEGTAHPDDCGMMFIGPGFPSCDSLLHLRPTNLFGKRVPSYHSRAGLAAEENCEKCIVRAHTVSLAGPKAPGLEQSSRGGAPVGAYNSEPNEDQRDVSVSDGLTSSDNIGYTEANREDGYWASDLV